MSGAKSLAAKGEAGVPYKWMALTVVSIGTFMSLLDTTMLNIALPTITRALSTDISTVQWVVTTYLLVITSTLLVFGRLGDLYGRKQIYVVGFAAFTVGAALCGFSQNIVQLIAFRAIQGVGGAMMAAISPAIGAGSFPPKERGMALGISTMTVAVGAMTGPTLGGFIIDAFDWRTAFFLRVPVGIIGTAWALHTLRKERPSSQTRGFDLAGAVTLCLALVSLLVAVNQGQRFGWNSPLILGSFASAIICAVSFVFIEHKISVPLVQLTLFRNRVFVGSSLASLLSFMASSANALLMPFYLQQALGYPAGRAGLMLIPGPIIMATFSPLSGWLSDRIGTRFLSAAGLTFQCAGLFLYSTLGEDATYTDVLLRLACTSFGAALFSSPNNSTIMGSVSHRLLGFVSSTLATTRNFGQVMGVAISASVFAGRLAYHTAQQASVITDEDALARSTFVAAFHDTVIVGAAICSLGILASILRSRAAEPDSEEASVQPVPATSLRKD